MSKDISGYLRMQEACLIGYALLFIVTALEYDDIDLGYSHVSNPPTCTFTLEIQYQYSRGQALIRSVNLYLISYCSF